MDFGVYSLVDVLVCKDSENRAKCKINCHLFSFLMEHQGQVGFPERYRFLFQQIPTAIIFQHLHLLDGNLVASLEFDGNSNCTEFNTIEIGIVQHLSILYSYVCHIVLVILALHWALRAQIYKELCQVTVPDIFNLYYPATCPTLIAVPRD